MKKARFSSRPTPIALLIAYVATLAALCATIWFGPLADIEFGLLAATMILAAVAAIYAGRTAACLQESVSIHERPSITGRGVGVLTFIALAALPILCTKVISPKAWPATVDEALATLDAQVGDERKRELAYLAYDDLATLHEGLGATIRTQLGLSSGNKALLRDCDAEYVDANLCSTVIISRFWKKLRADMPAHRRASMEALEVKMERVRLKPHEFKEQPLREIVAFLNDAIRTQLAEGARFTIHVDPADADASVTMTWRETETISLREGLRRLADKTDLMVRKDAPDLTLERTGKASVDEG